MKRKTVSLCVIARDEEATIGMAIKSVLALVDEVIVVDTGSRDNTRIIAEGYGARVVDVPWEDDFSAVRNTALSEASCDWVLVLDADEYLQPVRPVEFQRLLHDPAAAGYRLRMVSADVTDLEKRENRVRLFRNAPEVRYQYPINERIMPALAEWAVLNGLKILESDLAVTHEPRDDENRTRKRERNLRILRKAVVSFPEEPYFPYQLACEVLVMLDGEVLPVSGINGALANLHTAWQKARSFALERQRRLPWLADLGARIVSALLALDRVEDARTVVEQVRAVFPDHPQALLQSVAVTCRMLEANEEQWAAVSASGLVAGARSDLQRLLAGDTDSGGSAVDRRVRDLYPLRYLGELALMEGHVSDAVGLFEQALSLDPAYSAAWLGMAECSRFAGDRKRALKLYLRTITENANNHRAWIRGCDLMRETGFHDNADSWWRKVVDTFPEHPAVAAYYKMAETGQPAPYAHV
ncbi:glycosyltransferase [bacterium]|nr:glycosyltransferase [bacterium]